MVVGLSSGLWIDRLRESWVKDLAKEAAVEDGPVVYDKMPKEVLLTQQKENSLQMWQRQWTDTEKGAVTKAFFPSVRNRIRQKIPVFPELTTMLIGHGKIRSYLYRFGLTDTAMCPCEEEEETVDHLIFKCKKLNKNRNEMIKQIKTMVAIGPRVMKHSSIII